MNVIKRDGTPQEYSFLKIADAVHKAFASVEQEVPEKFLEQVKDSVEKLIIKNNGAGTPIEEIQDCIQNELIKRNKYEVVESFIAYRKERERIRMEESDLIKQINEKLTGSNVQNQNANLDEYSFGGKMGEAAGVVAKVISPTPDVTVNVEGKYEHRRKRTAYLGVLKLYRRRYRRRLLKTIRFSAKTIIKSPPLIQRIVTVYCHEKTRICGYVDKLLIRHYTYRFFRRITVTRPQRSVAVVSPCIQSAVPIYCRATLRTDGY